MMPNGAATPQEAIEVIIDAYVGTNPQSVPDRVEVILGLFADDAHVIGNLSAENWSEKAPVRAQLTSELGKFSQLRQTFYRKGSLYLAVEESGFAVAVLDGELTGEHGGRKFAHEGRWTCVLRRSDDGWLVAHSHFSIGQRSAAASGARE
jgi:ketosteroid isomerase-like protein